MNRLILLLTCCMALCVDLASAAMSECPRLAATDFALNAKYKVDTVWATSFQATVTLTNSTSAPTKSWTATFSLPKGYSLDTRVSGGEFKVNGQNVTVNNLPGKGVIAAGGSTTFKMMIIRPLSAPTVINNLQAAANGSQPPVTTVPLAPLLNSIILNADQSYTVSWNKVTNATSYILQEDTSADFSSPTTVAEGNILSYNVKNQPNGTYYYVALAKNQAGNSPYSNTQQVTVNHSDPGIPSTGTIEHSAWYIDWTSWFDGPSFVIPTGNNMLNIFVGELRYGTDNKPTLGGFGTFTLPQIDAFTAYCAAQSPSIGVKVSIGGGGGMYDHCWDLLTQENVHAFAQGAVDFCHAHGLVGVDFDYEAFSSVQQETLVGTLIKEFKTIDPKLQSSLCTNAGFGPGFPWQASVKVILDAATISPGNCAVDRMYIMSYYDPIEAEKNWVLGWANWLKQNYGFTPARVSVGIDDFDAHAYDPVEFAAWAASQGFSTAHWAFDPARP